ncbi:hypothetical protein ACQP1O_43085 (plasmid) [Nocardia sp. CA-151230]|uniref:hypothetical protein n=1 Tax=Nocardia sp. CA-151230 TaxID=3239982 RepID=UPI003D94E69F
MNTDPWPFPEDTTLERARRIARSYRDALMAIDPAHCEFLDGRAVAVGQAWVCPTQIPSDAIVEALDSVLGAKDISLLLGIPANTIYGWASKGLLSRATEDAEGKRLPVSSSPKYRVRDVVMVGNRRRARRLDIA